MKFSEEPESISRASLARRLAAIFYDSLLCIALMFVVTGLYMAISNIIFGGGTYRQMNESGQTINDPILTLLLLSSLYWFFGFFWTKSGQTLGMQVWHLRVQTAHNESITWTQALLRFLGALVSASLLGLGYLWVLFDKRGQSLHCHISKTQIVRIPKRK